MAEEAFARTDPVGGFPDTLKRVLTDPRGFFGTMTTEGGLQGPLVFALICLAIGGIEHWIFTGFRFGLKGVIGLVLIGAIRLFVGAAIVTIIAQQLFGGRGDYEASFRVLAYSTAVAVAIGLPVIKYFAALYGVFLVIVGLEKAHGFDAVRAFLTLIAMFVVSAVIAHAFGLWGLTARVNPLFR